MKLIASRRAVQVLHDIPSRIGACSKCKRRLVVYVLGQCDAHIDAAIYALPRNCPCRGTAELDWLPWPTNKRDKALAAAAALTGIKPAQFARVTVNGVTSYLSYARPRAGCTQPK